MDGAGNGLKILVIDDNSPYGAAETVRQAFGVRHVQVPVMYGKRLGGEAKTRFFGIFAKYAMEVFMVVYLRAVGRW